MTINLVNARLKNQSFCLCNLSQYHSWIHTRYFPSNLVHKITSQWKAFEFFTSSTILFIFTQYFTPSKILLYWSFSHFEETVLCFSYENLWIMMTYGRLQSRFKLKYGDSLRLSNGSLPNFLLIPINFQSSWNSNFSSVTLKLLVI